MKVIRIYIDRNILALFLVILGFQAKSQELYKEGYIITKSNESRKGLILEQSYNLDQVNCIFKLDINENIKTYNARDIKEFRYKDGRKFVSNQFGVNIDTTRVQFVEQLVSGGANLYYVNKIYYLVKQDNVPVILNYDQVIDKVNTPRGKGLSFLLSDCLDYKKSVNRIEYTHKYLIKTIKKYNSTCYDIKVEDYYSVKYKSVSLIEPKIGLSLSEMQTAEGLTLGLVPNLTYGLDYRLIFPYLKNRLDWQIGAYVYNQNGTFYYNTDIESGGVLLQEFNFGNSFIKIKALLGFSVIKSKFEASLNLGLSSFIPFISNDSVITETYDNNIVTTNEESLTTDLIVAASGSIHIYYNLEERTILGLEFGFELPLGVETGNTSRIYNILISYNYVLRRK